jgi:site-specific recombinase XerD
LVSLARFVTAFISPYFVGSEKCISSFCFCSSVKPKCLLPSRKGKGNGRERITFLASDGVEILKRYLEWRRRIGEKLTPNSPLFASRTRRGTKPLSPQKFNEMLKNVAKKAGLNGNGKYGRLRAHSLRKFFVTQLTNHGVEDKIVNFFIGHKIPDVDRVYWYRRIEKLRKITLSDSKT